MDDEHVKEEATQAGKIVALTHDKAISFSNRGGVML
jgi:hypothetical protein